MCFAFFAWFGQAALLAGIAKTATRKICNECKTLNQLGLVCLNTRTQVHFTKQPFSSVLSQEITEGPQAMMAKPATAFPGVVYITVILSYVSVSNCSLNCLNL